MGAATGGGLKKEVKINNSKLQKIVSENLLMALMPVLAYGVAYCFEAGYLRAFELPQFLITVNLERFFSAALILSGFLIILIGVADSISVFLPESFIKNLSLFFPVAVCAPILIFYIYQYDHVENKLLTSAIIFCYWMYLVMIYGFPFLICRNEKIGYIEAYRKYQKFTSEKEKNHLIRTLVQKFSNISLCFLLILILIPIVFGIGFFSAKGNAKYLVMNEGNSNYALIRSYSDLFIYVEITKKWISLNEFNYQFADSYLLLDTQPSNLVHHVKGVRLY